MDVAELAGEVTPFVTAAIGAYGSAVITKAEDLVVDEAADSTVGLGRRILDDYLDLLRERPARIYAATRPGSDAERCVAQVWRSVSTMPSSTRTSRSPSTRD
jgi:hypothetical protein